MCQILSLRNRMLHRENPGKIFRRKIMAIFSNQATLTYNGTTTNSNIAFGEILEVLEVSKTAVEANYTPGELVTYVVTLRNTGAAPLTGLTVTDDLGGYTFGTGTVYPLAVEADTVRLLVNGVLQPAPAVTSGPPVTVTGVNIPAGGDAVLVYQARVTGFADPSATGTIDNTVTLTGAGLSAPITATESIGTAVDAQLAITKSISPTQVVDNDRVSYTFVIQNTGNQAVDAADNAAITDTFDPILTDLAVTLNGAPFAQYTYNQATGLFATTPGAITVPAATVTQDATTGVYTLTPGVATLVVTGTI